MKPPFFFGLFMKKSQRKIHVQLYQVFISCHIYWKIIVPKSSTKTIANSAINLYFYQYLCLFELILLSDLYTLIFFFYQGNREKYSTRTSFGLHFQNFTYLPPSLRLRGWNSAWKFFKWKEKNYFSASNIIIKVLVSAKVF